jgi:hypothetical protein
MSSVRPEGVVGGLAEIHVGSHFFKAVAENNPDITLAVAIHISRRVHRLVVPGRDSFADEIATPVRIVAVGEVDLDDVFPNTVVVVNVHPPIIGVGGTGPGQGQSDGESRSQSLEHDVFSRDGIVRL